jgi:epoxide hydrolase-like predicted phosphatase
MQGLVVDWGGVLTADVGTAMAAWCADDGIAYDEFRRVMTEWLGPAAGAQAQWNPVHALERGEIEVPDFEARLAEALRRDGPGGPPAEGLLERMFARFTHAPDMAGLVRRAHEAGLRTALLSNSWGDPYLRDGWEEMFDAVVISGEVGMRKPEPRIYEHVLGLLDLPAPACVFVDDVPANVQAAERIGMAGIVHQGYPTTLARLEELFGLDLASPAGAQLAAGA